MICNKCNHTLPDDSVFCQYCGAELEIVAATTAKVTNEDTPLSVTQASAPIAVDAEQSIVDMTSEDALKAILQIQAENTIKAMEQNRLTQPNNECDAEFGLIPEKPIFTLATKSVDGEREYLDKLSSINGEKLSYKRRGSMSVASISGMIDIYDTFLPSGQLYKTIYINMYGAKSSGKVPAGFTFVNTTVHNHHVSNGTGSVKAKYCSRCGYLVDNESKICTGCGKQYFKGFKLKARHVVAIALSLVFALLIAIIIVQHSRISDLYSQKASLERSVNALRQEIFSLYDEHGNYDSLVTFVDDHVVFVEDDGTNLYHKFDCYRFIGDSFWVFNTEYAEYKGYSPCQSCH